MIVGDPSGAILGPRRTLRAHTCIALFALATAGCGATASATGSTFPEGGSEIEHACGTYTPIGEDVVARRSELDGVPYLEVVLGDADPCSELPLVVILHGLGDDPDVPRWPYRDLPVAVRMVLPHGPIPWGNGWAWSSVRTLDGEPDGLAATMAAQGDRIGFFLDSLTTTYPVRGGIILTGFSQGGILALTTLVRHPEHLSLVMPLAAWVPEALRTDLGAQVPVRWMHGLDDERVPYTMAVEAATDLRTRGYDVELVAYPGEHHHMSDAMDERFHSWLARALTNLESSRPIADGFVLVP